MHRFFLKKTQRNGGNMTHSTIQENVITVARDEFIEGLIYMGEWLIDGDCRERFSSPQ
jgi:hypothetical protein